MTKPKLAKFTRTAVTWHTVKGMPSWRWQNLQRESAAGEMANWSSPNLGLKGEQCISSTLPLKLAKETWTRAQLSGAGSCMFSWLSLSHGRNRRYNAGIMVRSPSAESHLLGPYIAIGKQATYLVFLCLNFLFCYLGRKYSRPQGVFVRI